jgi:hypothetical protein
MNLITDFIEWVPWELIVWIVLTTFAFGAVECDRWCRISAVATLIWLLFGDLLLAVSLLLQVAAGWLCS